MNPFECILRSEQVVDTLTVDSLSFVIEVCSSLTISSNLPNCSFLFWNTALCFAFSCFSISISARICEMFLHKPKLLVFSTHRISTQISPSLLMSLLFVRVATFKLQDIMCNLVVFQLVISYFICFCKILLQFTNV